MHFSSAEPSEHQKIMQKSVAHKVEEFRHWFHHEHLFIDKVVSF